MVPAPLGLAAVERGAAADRDERVLERGAPLVVGVDVAGRDRRHAQVAGELLEPRRAGGRPRARTAAGARRRTGRGNARATWAAAFGLYAPSPCRAQPERQTRPSFRSRSDWRVNAGGWRLVPRLRARAGVCLCEQPAEVRVALGALDEQRDVAAAFESDLRAGDRPQPERFRRVGELERAVHAVVVGERERLVAELGGPRGELLGLRSAVEERVCRVAVELDVGHSRRRWRRSSVSRARPSRSRGTSPWSRSPATRPTSASACSRRRSPQTEGSRRGCTGTTSTSSRGSSSTERSSSAPATRRSLRRPGRSCSFRPLRPTRSGTAAPGRPGSSPSTRRAGWTASSPSSRSSGAWTIRASRRSPPCSTATTRSRRTRTSRRTSRCASPLPARPSTCPSAAARSRSWPTPPPRAARSPWSTTRRRRASPARRPTATARSSTSSTCSRASWCSKSRTT